MNTSVAAFKQCFTHIQQNYVEPFGATAKKAALKTIDCGLYLDKIVCDWTQSHPPCCRVEAALEVMMRVLPLTYLALPFVPALSGVISLSFCALEAASIIRTAFYLFPTAAAFIKGDEDWKASSLTHLKVSACLNLRIAQYGFFWGSSLIALHTLRATVGLALGTHRAIEVLRACTAAMESSILAAFFGQARLAIETGNYCNIKDISFLSYSSFGLSSYLTRTL